MNWMIISKIDFWTDLVNQVIQFTITVFILSSIGVWFPLIPDWWEYTGVSETSRKAIPLNLMTYFMGIFSVAIYERVRYLLEAQNRKNKRLEYAFWFIVGLLFLIMSGLLLKLVKNNEITDAITHGLYCTLGTYIIWWLVYYQQPKFSAYNSLGGEIK